MSKKRARGNRIWLEHPPETVAVPHVSNQKGERRRKRYKKKLQVEVLHDDPYQFSVTDIKNDVAWLIQEGVDGQCSIVERPDNTSLSDRQIMTAIYKEWPHLRR